VQSELRVRKTFLLCSTSYYRFIAQCLKFIVVMEDIVIQILFDSRLYFKIALEKLPRVNTESKNLKFSRGVRRSRTICAQ
jgi:hypothetical protein